MSAAMEAFGLMPLAFVAVGLLFAWYGIRNVRAADAFRRDAHQAEAEITDVRWELVGPATDRDHLAFPVLKFTLPDGRIVETQSDHGTNWPPGEPGDHVTVLYQPDDPAHARIEGGFTGAAPTMVNGFIAAFGIFFALMGAGFFVLFQAFDFS
jgi:hypothetical protein